MNPNVAAGQEPVRRDRLSPRGRWTGGIDRTVDPRRTVARMPEEKQDPANTQMFRAFVARGEEEQARRGMSPAVLAVIAAVVIAIVAVVLIVS